jgi:DnaJ-class molecular chaperone
MDGRTYYMILGVPPTASEAGIRTAYHDLARRLHPDVAGQQATHAFQEISEAYDVLSDPRRRREYNEELRREQHGAAIAVHRTRAAPEARDRRPIPHQDRVGTLNVDVVLTPEEQRHGGVLPIPVPVSQRCPECGGSGRDWLFPCLACGRQGTIEDEAIVGVRIPPMTRSGAIFEVHLQGLDDQNFCLRVHVFVEPHAMNERS